MIVIDRRTRLALGGAALFAAGVGTAMLILRGRAVERPSTDQGREMAAMARAPVAPSTSGPVVVGISPELAARAGLAVAEVRTARISSTTRIPATVEPNAYNVVPIIAPAGGRVLRVLPRLGDSLAAGAPVAVLHSPELAKAASDEAAAAAALRVIDRDLDRTRKLVSIGAASRRELEQLEASRAEALSRVNAARAEVRLLGGGADRGGEMTVRAASAGVAIQRAVNAGVVVDRGALLVTTAPLSPVWIIGEIAEADLSRIRVGDTATVQSEAYPGLSVAGRVSYVAPEVRRETRTAQIRIEAPNPGGRLKFGMLAEARIEAPKAAESIAIPSSAIQRVGARTVVYVAEAGAASRYEERVVETGADQGGMTEIRTGLRAGERIVTTGSFFVRAEVERQGLRPADTSSAIAEVEDRPAPSARVIAVRVDAAGFTPSRIAARHGETVTLRFTRVSESCATEVIVPPGNTKKPLPLKRPVDIQFTASRTGEFAFTCGMDMLRGTIVVQ